MGVDLYENQMDQKIDERTIPPAIYDPGPFTLQWLLQNGENLEDLLECGYLTQQEIDEEVSSKSNVD